MEEFLARLKACDLRSQSGISQAALLVAGKLDATDAEIAAASNENFTEESLATLREIGSVDWLHRPEIFNYLPPHAHAWPAFIWLGHLPVVQRIEAGRIHPDMTAKNVNAERDEYAQDVDRQYARLKKKYPGGFWPNLAREMMDFCIQHLGWLEYLRMIDRLIEAEQIWHSGVREVLDQHLRKSGGKNGPRITDSDLPRDVQAIFDELGINMDVRRLVADVYKQMDVPDDFVPTEFSPAFESP